MKTPRASPQNGRAPVIGAIHTGNEREALRGVWLFRIERQLNNRTGQRARYVDCADFHGSNYRVPLTKEIQIISPIFIQTGSTGFTGFVTKSYPVDPVNPVKKLKSAHIRAIRGIRVPFDLMNITSSIQTTTTKTQPIPFSQLLYTMYSIIHQCTHMYNDIYERIYPETHPEAEPHHRGS